MGVVIAERETLRKNNVNLCSAFFPLELTKLSDVVEYSHVESLPRILKTGTKKFQKQMGGKPLRCYACLN